MGTPYAYMLSATSPKSRRSSNFRPAPDTPEREVTEMRAGSISFLRKNGTSGRMMLVGKQPGAAMSFADLSCARWISGKP